MMSDESGFNTPNDSKGNATARAAEPPPALRFGNVLKLVVPVVIVLGGIYAFFGMFDGMKWLSDAALPARVPVTGQVLFNGEPLTGALVFTKPTQPGLRGALATTDQNGHFKLVTEINGDFLEGAYVGEHLVKVEKRYSAMSFGVPPLMTPDKYASYDTSQFRIEVPEAGASVELALEGEPNPAPPPGPPGGILQPRPAGSEEAIEPAEENSQQPPAAPSGADVPHGERRIFFSQYDGPPSPSSPDSTASESRRTGKSISAVRPTEEVSGHALGVRFSRNAANRELSLNG